MLGESGNLSNCKNSDSKKKEYKKLFKNAQNVRYGKVSKSQKK